jgi:transcriptional regulator with XRE-family HTH domain
MPIDRQAVRKIMISKEITPEKLAKKMKVSKGRVSNILNKDVENSRIETITKLAKALDVNPLDIVKEE